MPTEAVVEDRRGGATPTTRHPTISAAVRNPPVLRIKSSQTTYAEYIGRGPILIGCQLRPWSGIVVPWRTPPTRNFFLGAGDAIERCILDEQSAPSTMVVVVSACGQNWGHGRGSSRPNAPDPPDHQSSKGSRRRGPWPLGRMTKRGPLSMLDVAEPAPGANSPRSGWWAG
jgi:hypothetical protein